MLPQRDHPLTQAYIAGAHARTPDGMRRTMEIIRSMERTTQEIIRNQCKLAAEVLMERKEA